MSAKREFEDGPNPCSCPPAVIEHLALAVRYAEASLGSSYPDAVLGAQYVKTFLEQPAEVWCAYVALASPEART